MKPSGFVRQVDQLGRVVVPKHIRSERDMNPGKDVELWLEDDSIVFERYYDNCIFCGSRVDINTFKGKHICGECQKELTTG